MKIIVEGERASGRSTILSSIVRNLSVNGDVDSIDIVNHEEHSVEIKTVVEIRKCPTCNRRILDES